MTGAQAEALSGSVAKAREAREARVRAGQNLLLTAELGVSENAAEQERMNKLIGDYREAWIAQMRAIELVGDAYLASIGWGVDR